VLPAEPEAFVQETFVLPTRDAESGIRVDFIFSTTPYERQAEEVVLTGEPVPFASAEDLLIHKWFAKPLRSPLGAIYLSLEPKDHDGRIIENPIGTEVEPVAL